MNRVDCIPWWALATPCNGWSPAAGPPRRRGCGESAQSLWSWLAAGLAVYAINLVGAVQPVFSLLITAVVVYLVITPRSLYEHADTVSEALQRGDIEQARHSVSLMVSRDTSQLNEQEVSAACCESVLENGSDGTFAALFWFCVMTVVCGGDYTAGLYGIVLYRAANTLDAMWGYKNERYLKFGWAAAKLDDLLNFLPSRLVAASYALMGAFRLLYNAGRRKPLSGRVPTPEP